MILLLAFALVPVSGFVGLLRLPRERQFVTAATLLGGLAFFCAFLGWVYVNLGAPCGGDGGEPYARPGSQAANFCGGSGAPFLVLVPTAAVAVGSVLSRVARDTRYLWALSIVGIGVEFAIGSWARQLPLSV